MNINEISTTQSFKTHNKTHPHLSVKELCAKHGWVQLGTGMEGTVVEHPNKPYVLKIFSNTSPYTDYVNFCIKNAGNNYLPVFNKEVKKVPGTEFNYVRMEKLTELTDTYRQSYSFICKLSVFVFFAKHANIRVGQHAVDMVTTRLYMTGYTPEEVFSDQHTFVAALKKIKNLPDQQWFSTVGNIVMLAKHIGSVLDVNPNNFMFRGSEVVITDPFV